MNGDGPEPDRPRGPSLLWLIAIVLIAVSIAVSVLTPFKLFILFLPLGLAPIFFGRWRR